MKFNSHLLTVFVDDDFWIFFLQIFLWRELELFFILQEIENLYQNDDVYILKETLKEVISEIVQIFKKEQIVKLVQVNNVNKNLQ